MYILLDIDGVMVTTPSWQTPEFLPDGFMAFNANCAKNLAMIIAITQANLVITSTHRIHYDASTWAWLLKNRGINCDNISITKINTIRHHADIGRRVDEVCTWVNQYQPERYVIIDDDLSLLDLPKNIKDHWVQTRFLIGLTKEGANQALQILNMP